MRRWTLRILVGFVILLLILAAAVQAVLWTDWPRRTVVAQLERELGLRVGVGSLSVGWMGGSSMRDVTFSLPLADDAVLRIDRLRVRHAAVPSLIFGRPLNLREMNIDQAALILRQDAGGRWNVQDVIELLARAGGQQKAQAGAAPAAALPRVTLVNGSIEIIDRKNRRAVVQPVALNGYPDSLLLWKYDVDVPSRLQLRGEVAPGGRWKHQVALNVKQIDPWLADWISNWPETAMLEGRWAGEFEDDGAVSGRLEIAQARFADHAATGTLVVRGRPSNLRIRPDRLIINASDPLSMPELRTTGGSATLVGSTLRTEGLRFAVGNDGMLDVDGEWNFFAGTAAVAAEWENIASLPQGATHSGSVNGSVSQPWPNQLQVDMRLQSRGSALGGNFAGDVRLAGQGSAWDALNLQVTAPSLSWQGKRAIAFNDVVASISTQGSSIALNDIRATTQGRIAGSGAIDLGSGDWKLWLDAGGWTLPRTGDASVNFMVNAWGNAEKVRLKELFVRTGDVDAVMSGWYVYALPKPLDADLYVTHVPEAAVVEAETQLEQDRLIRGKLRGQGHLNGTVSPMDLSVQGTLFGRNLFVRQRPLGDVALILSGTINADEAQFESQELALLGGRWRVRGYQPFAQRDMQLSIEVQDLPMSEVSDLIEARADFAGTLDGRWIIDLPAGEEWSRQSLRVDGSFEAGDVRAPNFAADRIEAKLSMNNGLLSIDPIVMHSGEQGSVEASLSINAGDFRNLKLQLSANNWPVQPERMRVSAMVGGTAELDVNLGSGGIFGPVSLTADVTGAVSGGADAVSIGQVRLDAQLTEQIIDIQSLAADALGGHVRGSATIHRNDLLQTIAQLECDNIAAQRLVELFPRADGLTGTFSAAAKLSPARDPRALEPLRLNVAIESRDAALHGAQLGNAEINAFLNTGRFVLDRSTLLFADGTIEAWARTSRHETERLFTQLIVEYSNLDLNQLVHMGAPAAEAFPGRLGGSLTLVGSPQKPDNAFGDGTIRLSDAEIGNSDIIEPLYIAMNLGKNFDRPTGSGSARLRLEKSTLNISQLRYFNRGTEVRADVSIADAWKLPDSPIRGFAVGSARPLKDIDLPWLADVDQIFSVLQANVTSVRVSGTVRNPERQIVPFGEIGASMRRFLFGDVKHDTLDK